jgi:hypothetical protein
MMHWRVRLQDMLCAAYRALCMCKCVCVLAVVQSRRGALRVRSAFSFVSNTPQGAMLHLEHTHYSWDLNTGGLVGRKPPTSHKPKNRTDGFRSEGAARSLARTRESDRGPPLPSISFASSAQPEPRFRLSHFPNPTRPRHHSARRSRSRDEGSEIERLVAGSRAAAPQFQVDERYLPPLSRPFLLRSTVTLSIQLLLKRQMQFFFLLR